MSIVSAIEGTPSKLSSPMFRSIYFRALAELQSWEKVVTSASEIDIRDLNTQRIVAKAYANLHLPDKAFQIIRRLRVEDPSDISPSLEILYEMRGDAGIKETIAALQDNPRLIEFFKHAPFMRPTRRDGKEDYGFRSWTRELLKALEN